MIQHIPILLPPKPRGFHLITEDIINGLGTLPNNGILHLFIQHTSAGILINEAADPDVLIDFEAIMNRIVPEDLPFLRHTLEGPDDMPAHVKSSIVGHHISIPIINARLGLGTWQGIMLAEFRNRGGSRKVMATIFS